MQSLGNRAVPGLPVAGRAQTCTLGRLPESLGMDRKKTAPTEAIGSILECSREAKREIPAEYSVPGFERGPNSRFGAS